MDERAGEVEAADEVTLLILKNRRNKATGCPEQVRVTIAPFKARLLTHIRKFYWDPEARDWRPSPEGLAIREDEIDRVLAAVQVAKARIEAEGRLTSQAAPGTRNPTPKAVARRREAERKRAAEGT
jgi:hypothetical protein